MLKNINLTDIATICDQNFFNDPQNLKLLQEILNDAKINLGDVLEAMTKKRKKQIINNHPYSISQGKDGRWRTRIPDPNSKEKRKMICKSSLEALYQALYDYYGDEGPDEKQKAEMTLETLYPLWIEYKKLHTTAPNYITRIHADWKKFYEGTEITQIPICKLTKLTLDEWAHKIIKEYALTKNAYYNMAVIMRQSLWYAVDLEIISQSPFDNVKIDARHMFRKVLKPSDETQVFTVEEKEAITLWAWEDFKNSVKIYELAPLALLFQFQTGVRIGELCAIRYEDLEHDGNDIHIQKMYRRDTKEVLDHTKSDCGDRIIPLTPEAKRIIQSAQERQKERGVKTEYIFSLTNQPLSSRPVQSLYVKYSKRLGIPNKSSHKARKTVTSVLIDANMNLNTVRKIMGHADERTTLNNYCFDRASANERRKKFEEALSTV
jgi:integrase